VPAEEAEAAWAGLRTLDALPADPPLWRISLAAHRLPALAARLEGLGAAWLADWGGQLVWAASGADPVPVREAVAALGGHAMLWRAPPDIRQSVPAFHPGPPAHAALEARVRAAFDPRGLFATGRFDAH
jgi:glycolate oxidase FAD binding subunit